MTWPVATGARICVVRSMAFMVAVMPGGEKGVREYVGERERDMVWEDEAKAEMTQRDEER